jgi:hypothetical protein
MLGCLSMRFGTQRNVGSARPFRDGAYEVNESPNVIIEPRRHDFGRLVVYAVDQITIKD